MRNDELLVAIQNCLRRRRDLRVGSLDADERDALLENAAKAIEQEKNESAPPSASADIAGADKVFKRIMVAVDQSEQAIFATRIAAALAKALHSELSLIHVIHVLPPTNPDLAYEQFQYRPDCFREGQDLLDRTAERLSGLGNVEKILREGDPAVQIADAATRLGADLVVMGTHGRGRFASAVVGSVAQGVMRKVICPVLCVAHDAGQIHTTIAQCSTQADYFPIRECRIEESVP